MAKVLVTGGAGFIGSNLVRALLERGDDVRVLDNFSTGNRANLEGLDVEVVEGELRSYERVHNAVRGTELVYHLGALGSVPRSVQDPLTSSAVNVEGTLNVLLAARDEGVRRVVFASSSSVYGSSAALPDARGRAARPALAVRRREARRRALLRRVLARLRALRDASSLRYFNVFGPRQSPFSQYAAVIPLFITAIGDGRADHDRRRRRAVARLHLRRRTSSTATLARGRHGGRERPGLQRRRPAPPASVNDVADAIGRILGKPVERAARAAARRRHPRLVGRHHRGARDARLRAAGRARGRAAPHGRVLAPEPIRVLRAIARLNMGGPALHVSYLSAGLATAATRRRSSPAASARASSRWPTSPRSSASRS